MKQIRILTRLELCNLYGFNMLRHIKDPEQKKKTKIFACIITFLLIMVLSYIVALCAGLGVLGAAEIIPAYLIALASFFILFFDVFKIGGVIFRQKGYDMVTSLPLADGAIVTSRCLRMYVESLIVSGLIFVPGMIVYGVFEAPGAATWFAAFAVMLLTPILPLAVAVLLGTLITGISSRMKHKALAEAGISLVVVVGVLALSTKLGGIEEEFTLDMLARFSELATQALQRVYPTALFLGNAVNDGAFFGCLLYGAVSLTIVAIVMWVVKKNFHTICRNLYTVRARHDYRMGDLKSASVKNAVLQREARRYFASGPYVSNTIIGPALGAAASVALLFVDTEEEIAKLTAQVSIELNFMAAVPLMVAAVMAMMNAVCMSVSMEGKSWWITKSLPLDTKTILDGKLIFNLLLIAPFFIVAQICLLIALKPEPLDAVFAMTVSLLLVVFSCVFGLRINLLFPKFDWENEVVAVKQSASSLLGGMGGVLVTILFVIPVILVPQHLAWLVYMVEVVVLLVLTRSLYVKNNKMDLSGMN